MSYSPMMTHYLTLKEQHKDCVVFYRLGDFYEMFFDDAVRVSKLLDLTLTGRDCGDGKRAPMCGVPFHAADAYISKLVKLGEKVAICEQLENPKNKSGEVVKRDVIRIVTAGTVTDGDALDERENSFISSVCKTEDEVAIAWADITTGEFYSTCFQGDKATERAISYLINLKVKEIICNDDMLFASKDIIEVKRGILPRFSSYLSWTYGYAAAERSLLDQFKAKTLSAYSVSGKKCAVCACGSLLEYLRETQKHALVNINNVKYISPESRMQLDSAAIRNLEIVKSLAGGKKYGSLLWLLDKTNTAMGARLLSNLIISPLGSAERINYRLDGVEELFNSTVVRIGISELLSQCKDIERLAGRVSNDIIMPRDCLYLAQSLLVVPNIRFRLAGFSSKVLNDVSSHLVDLSELANLINSAIEPENTPSNLRSGGFIKKGYNAKLDELREIRQSSTQILSDLETRERDATNIRTLKVGFNRVFGYYLEVSKSFKDKVPTRYQRKQTLANSERYVTEELKSLEDKILTSEEWALKLETELYEDLKAKILANINNIKVISDALAKLDVLTAFAEISKSSKYVRPEIVSADRPLDIKEGRHPVVEAISNDKFIPNDALLDEGENRTMILTGPNMAGKSTYMRQNAIIAIMAHIGCFVPAKSASIPVIDRIFTRVGASDNLILDQSTFMVEMIEVASILQNATKNSLLILDEVGRGTSTYDGLSIAWAVIEHITKKIGAKTMFATHYHELTELENKLSGVKNYKISVKEFNGEVVFLRKIMRGGANRSFGIEVAALAGVPQEVTQRAKELLKKIESGDVTLKIESDVEEPEKQQSEVERILSEIDLNNLSPMQAFLVLSDLVEKVK